MEREIDNVKSLETMKNAPCSLALELKCSTKSNEKPLEENRELIAKCARSYNIKNFSKIKQANHDLKRQVAHLNQVIRLKNDMLKRERASKSYSMKQNESSRTKNTS